MEDAGVDADPFSQRLRNHTWTFSLEQQIRKLPSRGLFDGNWPTLGFDGILLREETSALHRIVRSASDNASPSSTSDDKASTSPQPEDYI